MKTLAKAGQDNRYCLIRAECSAYPVRAITGYALCLRGVGRCQGWLDSRSSPSDAVARHQNTILHTRPRFRCVMAPGMAIRVSNGPGRTMTKWTRLRNVAGRCLTATRFTGSSPFTTATSRSSWRKGRKRTNAPIGREPSCCPSISVGTESGERFQPQSSHYGHSAGSGAHPVVD